MRIAQINPGLIPIGPKGPNAWGAIERIIWNYKNALEILGHTVDIKSHTEIEKGQYDIVHSHTWNQSIELANREIGVINHLHDHHVVLWGKDSPCYVQNKEAFKKSLIGLVPAEFAIDYFENPYHIFYLPHGVDSNFFKPAEQQKGNIRLLCIANNGYLGQPTADRKGFCRAVLLAQKFNLPITIAGPSNNNRTFFAENKDLLSYPNLNVLFDLDDSQLLNLYQTHSVFLHFSQLEMGHPNLTLLEALSCGLPVIGNYQGSEPLPGLLLADNGVNDDTLLKEALSKLPTYQATARQTGVKFDYQKIIFRLEKVYTSVLNNNPSFNTPKFKMGFTKTFSNPLPKTARLRYEPDDKFTIHFIDGAFCEITGRSKSVYHVEFWDKTTNQKIHESDLRCQHWSRTARKHFTDWQIKIQKNGRPFFTHEICLKNKRVFIAFESKSLGDTLAFIPMVEKFQQKHRCKIICSTFWNNLFQSIYPEWEFVLPGQTVSSLTAKYSLGIFDIFDRNVHPIDIRKRNLQQSAADILGLEWDETIPCKLFIKDKTRKIQDKYITISPSGSAGLKYWHYPNGWQTLIDHFSKVGYKVVLTQTEPTDLKGLIIPEDKDIQTTINLILNSECHIGISSGPAWIAYAVKPKNKIVLISGFTEPFNEFDCERIFAPESKCRGCYNRTDDDRFNFFTKEGKGNWDFCPISKENPTRHFECTKSIPPQTVIEKVENILKTS